MKLGEVITQLQNLQNVLGSEAEVVVFNPLARAMCDVKLAASIDFEEFRRITHCGDGELEEFNLNRQVVTRRVKWVRQVIIRQSLPPTLKPVGE